MEIIIMNNDETAIIQNVIYDLNKAITQMECDYEHNLTYSLTAYSIIMDIREKLLKL